MPEYRLDFPISAGSPEPLQRIAQAATQIETGTKKATEGVQAFDRSSDKLSKTIADLRGQFSQLNPQVASTTTESGKASNALGQQASAAKEAAEQIRGLGAAHRTTLSDVQAASAAIRGLEGHLSIRAVEQYTTKILGLGGAFQAIFPIVGGIAFIGVLEQMVSKVGDLYNAWSPVIRAQKESLEVMQGIAKEGEKLYQQQQRNLVKDAEYRAEASQKGTGRQAGLRLEASLKSADAKYGSVEIAGQTYTAPFVQQKIAEQQAILADTRDGTIAGVSARNVAAEKLRRYQEINSLLNDQAKLLQHEADTLRQQASDIDRDRAEQKSKEAAAKAKANRSAYRSINDQIAAIDGKSEYANLPPAIAAILQRRDAVARGIGENEALTGGQQAALSRLLGASTGRRMGSVGAAEAAGNAYRDSGFALENDSRDFVRSLREQMTQMREREAEDRDTLSSLTRVQGIERQSQVSDVVARSTRQGRLSQLAYGPGQEAQAINDAYTTRLRLATELKAMEDEAARKELDVNQQRVYFAKSAADFRKLEQDAALDREEKILTLKKKGQEEYVRSVEGAFQALVNGGGRGLGQYARGQALGYATTIVGNIARSTYQPGALSLTSNPNSPLGKILAGTPFGAASGDKLQTAGDLLQKAAGDLSAAAQFLASGGTSAMPELSVGALGGGAITGGIGGLAGMIGPGGTSGFAGPLGKIFGGGTSAAISGFMGGMASVSTGNAYKILAGRDFSVETANGTNTASNMGMLSTSSRIGAGVGLGTAAVVGGVTAARAFSRGNTLAGIGALAGTAAAFDPEPISKGVLMAASALITLFGGDPKQRRANEIEKNIANSRFYEPVAMNVSAGMNGGLVDYDRYGNIRGSNLSPYPTTQAPYMDYRNNTYVPGRVVSGYGGSGPGLAPNVTVNINALDSQSIRDRSQDITDAVAIGIQGGGAGTQFMDALRQQL